MPPVCAHTCARVHTHTHTHTLTHTTLSTENYSRKGNLLSLANYTWRVWAKERCAAAISRKESQLPSEAEVERQAGWRTLRVCYVFLTSQSEPSKHLEEINDGQQLGVGPDVRVTSSDGLRWQKDRLWGPERAFPLAILEAADILQNEDMSGQSLHFCHIFWISVFKLTL